MSSMSVIDDKPVEVKAGESILAAARRVGIQIPTLCHDDRLSPVAGCRLCLVKVKGALLPVAACSQKLTPGMVVTTNDTDLRRTRRQILRLVLSENPSGKCPKCRDGSPCELHALAQALDVESGFMSQALSGRDHSDSNPFIVRDYSQCIHCYRCTRVCSQVERAAAIAPAGRGYQTRISAAFGADLLGSPCTFCGQCVQTCPTGALRDRKLESKSSAETLNSVRTVCPYCGTGCGIELQVSRGRVVGSKPDWKSPVNGGSLCVKGQFGLDFIHSSDRLTTPLIRRNGRFEESSWEEAYDYVASRFRQIREESGPEAFAFWSSSRSTNESNYMMQKFARAVIGTNNVDNCART